MLQAAVATKNHKKAGNERRGEEMKSDLLHLIIERRHHDQSFFFCFFSVLGNWLDGGAVGIASRLEKGEDRTPLFVEIHTKVIPLKRVESKHCVPLLEASGLF